MKTRTGFVSNSSSTSFIVLAEDNEKARTQGLELFKVSDLLSRMTDIANIIRDAEMKSGAYPSFFDYSFYLTMPFYNELSELERKHPGCYITEPYDRDRAYTEGIDNHYEAFEEDL